jgi:hypothetical protein
MWALFKRRTDLADLIPLVPQQDWERYHLFEARGEEAHALSDRDLADRCGVDHDVPRFGVRFASEEMCDIQWFCTATYYAWLDKEAMREGRPSEPVVASFTERSR